MKQETKIAGADSVWQSLTLLALPAIAEQFLSIFAQYADTAMVGRLGEQATAAVSVTMTVTWLLNNVMFAAAAAILTMTAQAFGAKRKELLQKTVRQAVLLALGLGAALAILAVGFSPFIPGWMGAEVGIRRQASLYFAIVSLPMVFRAMTIVLSAVLRGVKDARTPLRICFCANLLNLLLNYVLIYTAGLGVTGAAVATAISYVFSGVATVFACRKNPLLSLRGRWQKPDFSILRRALHISVPLMGSGILNGLGFVVFAALVSGMGTSIFAAHSIAVTAETLFYMPGYGLRSATSAMVGISLGERNPENFRKVCRTSIFMILGMMLLSGVLLFLIAYPLMCFFTESTAAARLGAKVLRLAAFSEPFFGIMVVMQGILYGLERTRYAMWVEIGSMWGVRILFSFLSVKVWGYPLQAVWICMIADNVCKAMLLSLPMCRRGGLYPKTEKAL